VSRWGHAGSHAPTGSPRESGGEGGIRTPERGQPPLRDFQSRPFNHSGTSPGSPSLAGRRHGHGHAPTPAVVPFGPVDPRPVLLLSIDYEDWHQLVRRRVGAHNWSEPGPALKRQTDALLSLLDELDAKATFFILGMAARAHPELVEAVVRRGHEIGCHGDAHLPVHAQTPGEFAADLESARGTIERLTGREPHGYRAPAFSITRDASWAYDVLAEQGFKYDASQHDTPRIRDRAVPLSTSPHPLKLSGTANLWEFPVAVWCGPFGRLPVGGASYWAALPTGLVVEGLERAGDYGGLYLHPHELDPQPLRVLLPPGASPLQRLHAAARAAQRNSARWRAATVLRAIANRFRLIPYGEAHAYFDNGAHAGP
jgi:polysaccharide deacetylase family protein (PEP-CTERM system associated)